MKKLLSIVLCIILLITVMPLGAVMADEVRIVIGDANGDGEINSSDLIVFRKLLISYKTGEFDECLDANGDGSFDICDLIRIKRHLADSSIPIGKTENKIDPLTLIKFSTPYKGIFIDDRLVIGDSCEVMIQFDKNSNTGIYGITEFQNGHECAGKGNDFIYEVVDNKIIIESCTDRKSKMEIILGSNGNIKIITISDNNGSLDCFRVGDILTT